MKQLIIKISIFSACLFPVLLSAQFVKDIRINEIQVKNSDGFRDEYGRSVSWIELFNQGFNKVNIAGCYLKVDGIEYRISRNDPKTWISTQGYLIFIAAGDSERGTFHTNFTLDNTHFVEFYSNEHELVDRFEFDPAQMTDNVSFGWILGEGGKEILTNLPATTPGASNNTVERIHPSDLFRQSDPHGVVLTITAIVAVAIVLTLLCCIFTLMGRFNVRSMKRKEEMKRSSSNDFELSNYDEPTNEELVAITIALHKCLEELHDHESMLLTINHSEHFYSPWSSKTYGLTKIPNRKK